MTSSYKEYLLTICWWCVIHTSSEKTFRECWEVKRDLNALVKKSVLIERGEMCAHTVSHAQDSDMTL